MSAKRRARLLASLLAAAAVIAMVGASTASDFSFVAAKKPKPAAKKPAHKKPAENPIGRALKIAQDELAKTNKALADVNQQIANEQSKARKAQDEAEVIKKDADAQQAVCDKMHADNQPIYDKVKAAKDKLDEIADKLIEGLPTNSPVAQAKVAWDAAKQKEQDELDRVLNLPEFRKAYEQAQDSENRVAMADLRDKYIQADPRALEATRAARDSREEYHALRDKLLQADANWQVASDKFNQIKGDADQVRNTENEARKTLADMQRKYREKLSVATLSEAAIQRDQAKASQLNQVKAQITAQVQRFTPNKKK